MIHSKIKRKDMVSFIYITYCKYSFLCVCVCVFYTKEEEEEEEEEKKKEKKTTTRDDDKQKNIPQCLMIVMSQFTIIHRNEKS
jgi:Na+/melibiose symporter-like transporter